MIFHIEKTSRSSLKITNFIRPRNSIFHKGLTHNKILVKKILHSLFFGRRVVRQHRHFPDLFWPKRKDGEI